MSKSKEHAQAIANSLAIDEYKTEFHKLPADIQDELFKRGCEIAQKEIDQLALSHKLD